MLTLFIYQVHGRWIFKVFVSTKKYAINICTYNVKFQVFFSKTMQLIKRIYSVILISSFTVKTMFLLIVWCIFIICCNCEKWYYLNIYTFSEIKKSHVWYNKRYSSKICLCIKYFTIIWPYSSKNGIDNTCIFWRRWF